MFANDSNVIDRTDEFSQICIWPYCILGDNTVEDFTNYMLNEYHIRVKFIDEIKVNDDRTDIAFYIHHNDISSFAIPRLATDIKWFEDAIDNGYCREYPESFMEKYKCEW